MWYQRLECPDFTSWTASLDAVFIVGISVTEVPSLFYTLLLDIRNQMNASNVQHFQAPEFLRLMLTHDWFGISM